MKLPILSGCVLLSDNWNFQKYLENGCKTIFFCLSLCNWPLTAFKPFAFPASRLSGFKNLHTFSYVLFFINLKIITFLFLQLCCQKIAFCLCGSEPMSWPLCHRCSLPWGAHWCLLCWEPYGHFCSSSSCCSPESCKGTRMWHQGQTGTLFMGGMVMVTDLWLYLKFPPRHFPPSYLLPLDFM